MTLRNRRKAEDAIVRNSTLYSLFDLRTLSDKRIAELYQQFCLPPIQEKSK